ncbi:GNAT family N-acetyltransferase [Jannaschia marina]|uniref:GNAT family N-acetyltransferase n=1 Tax=Jannaschia marina TaxID=2741674 RepID=UPI0015CB6F96|nr:GNAT family N-acetyltransferase [Jannaschia marina]
MKTLGPPDRDWIVALLDSARTDTMFPQSNLRTHGFGGTHMRALRLWGVRDRAVLALGNDGMILPYLPDPSDIPAAAEILRGERLRGAAGPARMVRPLLDALGLTEAPKSLDADEPQFELSLDALIVPEGPGDLVPVSVDAERAICWRQAYNAELQTGSRTLEDTTREVEGWIAEDSHRFLVVDGRPAAMTGFNATLPEIVQVGGVYTPPETRGRGLARRALALHLAEARATGVETATLFAASDAAVACYTPLGFQRTGTFTLLFFEPKVTP